MVIAKNDFERYEIVLPLSALAGRRRKSFLYSELEKMHPCFSDEFCFDMMPRKVGRKGVSAEVLVMSKNKLAEYEGKRRFCGNGFKIEGEKYHRFFIDKKFAVTIWMTAVCLLVAAGGLLSGVLAGKLTKQKIEETNAAKINGAAVQVSVPASVQSQISENIMEKEPLEGELLIEKVAAASGKITSFEWSIDGFTEKLNACVEGVYPENLENSLAPQTVTYVNGIPKLTISFIKSLNASVMKTVSSDTKETAFNVQIRNLIRENGAEIKEERTAPYRCLFSCSSKDGVGELFTKLSQFVEDNQKKISFIRLTPQISQSSQSSQSSQASLLVELSVESIPVRGFDLELISGNLNLFFEEKNIYQKAPEKTMAVQIAATKKIGEIKRSDNSIVVFYKNKEGKMEKKLIAEEKRHD